MCSPAYGTFRHGMSPGLREDKTKSFMYAHKPDCNGRFMRFFIRIKISGGDYMKKRILALLLVIAMAVLMLSACGNKEQETTTTETTVATREIRKITTDDVPEGKVLLSSLSDEELAKIFADYGYPIELEKHGRSIASEFAFMESDIDCQHGLGNNWGAAVEYRQKIRSIARDYYGVQAIRKITADNVPEGKVLLSSLDSEALRSFLADKGVTLSDDVPYAELHSFILVVESDIDFERYLDPLRWPTLNNQPAKNIHKVVKEYYGY